MKSSRFDYIGNMQRDAIMPLSNPSRPCPICGKTAEHRYRPFCSTRCARLDLGRWLNGNYAIATEERVEPETQGPPER